MVSTTLIETLTSAPVISAAIGGTFAIICKLLEAKSSQQTRSRGLLGWLAVIAAVAAIALALMSISMSRMVLQSEGILAGSQSATAEVLCSGKAMALISVQVEATGYPKKFRTALTPQLLVNGNLVARTMNRNTNGDGIRHHGAFGQI
jgi:hypothetical protein